VNKVLPSLWILGAIGYAAATLMLAQIFFYGGDGGSRPDAAGESMRAKDTARLPGEPPALQLGAGQRQSNMPTLPPPRGVFPKSEIQPSSATQSEQRNELVKVAGNAAVVRSEPAASAPMLFAYPVGRPLRVVERHAGFARVEDLRSGQLGWIEETALAPNTAGHPDHDVTRTASTRPSKGLAENELWDTPAIIEKKRDHSRRAAKKRRGLAGVLRRAFGRL
jgi:hypothetical protein